MGGKRSGRDDGKKEEARDIKKKGKKGEKKWRCRGEEREGGREECGRRDRMTIGA